MEENFQGIWSKSCPQSLTEKRANSTDKRFSNNLERFFFFFFLTFLAPTGILTFLYFYFSTLSCILFIKHADGVWYVHKITMLPLAPEITIT